MLTSHILENSVDIIAASPHSKATFVPITKAVFNSASNYLPCVTLHEMSARLADPTLLIASSCYMTLAISLNEVCRLVTVYLSETHTVESNYWVISNHEPERMWTETLSV
jgi:hypothetical protein